MKVQLLDVKAQYDENNLRDGVIPLIDEICSSQGFVGGKRIEDFESAIAEYSNCKYACGVSSGSDALIISLMVTVSVPEMRLLPRLLPSLRQSVLYGVWEQNLFLLMSTLMILILILN